MADLSDLYQQVIIEHNRSPRNYRRPTDANRSAQGDNPLCGDHIDLYVRLDDDRIADIGFQGRGCAISRATASLMTGAVLGKTTAEAERLFGAFHDLVTGAPASTGAADLGKLAALGGVRQYPARVKCASLAWHALRAALREDVAPPVTTEAPAE
jgi:nitrogen fixation NifU-like protein